MLTGFMNYVRGTTQMGKKVNPRNRPATWADVERARRSGKEEGIKGSLMLMLYTLRDKFSYTDEQLQAFADAYNYTLDSVNRGYVKESDLECVIREEYGTTINMI